MVLKQFVFNPFSENTYVLSDDSKQCVIIDPGCHISEEEEELASYISANGLKPVRLLNTHCHVDHVFGNYFVANKWNLQLEIHKDELRVLHSFPQVCKMYGFHGGPQPEPGAFLEEGQHVRFGKTVLNIFCTPGHSPGSVCFYNDAAKVLIGGDVLFQNSIGRTDLPGGDQEQLFDSIRTKLFVLPGDVKVFSGHGPYTTIGWEKKNNPFVSDTDHG